jgi:hypothetical protein
MSLPVDPLAASGSLVWLRRTLACPMSQIRARRGHSPQEHVRLSILILCLALMGSGITPAGGESPELRKPPPEEEQRPDAARLAEAIGERYPDLVTDTEGTPFVTLVFDPYGHVETSAVERLAPGARDVVATAETFGRFGLPPGTLHSIGLAHVRLGARIVPVAFGVTNLRELDRALVEERFPGVLARHQAVDGDLWILFDHSGRPISSGIEHANPSKLRKTLEQRYPGITTVSMRVTEVYARDGHAIGRSPRGRLHLYSVWLAPQSQSLLPSQPEPLQGGR